MNLKKLSGLALAAVLLMGTLTGCSKEKLVMATNAEFPPFEYVTDKGLIDKFDGVDVAIANEIAKSMGKELVIENMEFTAVLAAVPTGVADFALAGMTVNEERLENMDFSIPYYTATQYIVVAEDNDSIKTGQDLVDKKVGVIDGYTGQTICMTTLNVKDLQGFKKGVDAVTELVQGKLDAVVIDSHTALALIAQKNENGEGVKIKYIEDPTVFESEQYAVAVKKGNTELLEKINKVLTELKENGKLDEFVVTYTQKAGLE